MKTFGRYIDGLLNRRAMVRRARVVSTSSTGVRVRFDGSEDEVTATLAAGTTSITIGQEVEVSRLSAGGVPNGGYRILGTSSSIQPNRGASDLSFDAETVTLIDDNPTVLVAGGAAVQVLIYGVNLETAPTYGDVLITDDVAQDINTAGTLITLSVKADGALAPGRYSLTVAGMTIDDLFEVTP